MNRNLEPESPRIVSRVNAAFNFIGYAHAIEGCMDGGARELTPMGEKTRDACVETIHRYVIGGFDVSPVDEEPPEEGGQGAQIGPGQGPMPPAPPLMFQFPGHPPFIIPRDAAPHVFEALRHLLGGGG